MRHTKKVLGVCIAFVLVIGLQAQTATPASGGKASGSGGTLCYTVGQVAYTSTAGANGSAVQGVQQAYDIWLVSGVYFTEISLHISAYPNPASDYLKLKIDSSSHNIQNINYELYDLQGKCLDNRKLISDETHIDMSNLIPATYFIKVVKDNKELKTS